MAPAIYRQYPKIVLNALATPGPGYFWSGCAGKILRGLEVPGFSLIAAHTRASFHLQTTWTPPANCLKDHKLTSYVVADAVFSKKEFVDKMRTLGLHLVCKR